MPLIMKFARQEDDELKEHVLQVRMHGAYLTGTVPYLWAQHGLVGTGYRNPADQK